ncbi:glucosamine-6-phosphate deaminase [Acidobacteria bacterium AH-259-A15]|nr:glucosamine-6-phosphate deaminase [Acidobacteria bacterium AH-259-A15]
MQIQVFKTKEELGKAAAERAAEGIREAINERQQAYLIAATGASQFEFLDSLVVQPGIDWSKTTFFHLDEYVGLPESHPASFRRYLKERIVKRIHPGEFFFIEGDHPDPDAECRRVGNLILQHTIDIAFVGIGENGHLAFNDPPADFETEDPYLVVELDEVCRRQQLGEGWFRSLQEVPPKAISMSVQQVLKARQILCSVPDKRKAEAVRDCLEKEISPQFPASILRRHPGTVLLLDEDSASLLVRGR